MFICDECVEVCNDIIADADNRFENREASCCSLAPPEIKKFLDEYVIGQERTKRKLAVAVYNHYKRIDIEAAAQPERRRVDEVEHHAYRADRHRQDAARPDIGQAPRPVQLSVDATTLTEAGTSARTSRTSSSSCCRPPVATSRSASRQSSTSTKSTRFAARTRTPRLPATSRARVSSRRSVKIWEGNGGERAPAGRSQAPAPGVLPDLYDQHPVQSPARSSAWTRSSTAASARRRWASRPTSSRSPSARSAPRSSRSSRKI